MIWWREQAVYPKQNEQRANVEVNCLLWALCEFAGGKNKIMYTQKWACLVQQMALGVFDLKRRWADRSVNGNFDVKQPQHRFKSNAPFPLLWSVWRVPSRNIRHSTQPIRLWVYHYAFRFAVKNASVNTKRTRTKCIILLFGPDQTKKRTELQVWTHPNFLSWDYLRLKNK